MKRYTVRLTLEVESDLINLFDYIARQDSVDSAYQVLDQLESLIRSLDQQPQRGHYPPELHVHGMKDFREVFFKPYRLIHQVIESEVIVLGCFDRRRDMQSLLERRLLATP